MGYTDVSYHTIASCFEACFVYQFLGPELMYFVYGDARVVALRFEEDHTKHELVEL